MLHDVTTVFPVLFCVFVRLFDTIFMQIFISCKSSYKIFLFSLSVFILSTIIQILKCFCFVFTQCHRSTTIFIIFNLLPTSSNHLCYSITYNYHQTSSKIENVQLNFFLTENLRSMHCSIFYLNKV